MMSNRFPKSKRLCSQFLIDRLFEHNNNKSLTAFPLRLVYRLVDKPDDGSFRGNDDSALLISVPKRMFKHAVDRNHVKRQVREAYRTNQQLIKLPEGKVAHIALLWLDNKHHPTHVVEKKVRNLLQRMSEKE